MPQSTTWDRRLYFPSEGRLAEDLSAVKNLTGFEPANSGTRGQTTDAAFLLVDVQFFFKPCVIAAVRRIVCEIVGSYNFVLNFVNIICPHNAQNIIRLSP